MARSVTRWSVIGFSWSSSFGYHYLIHFDAHLHRFRCRDVCAANRPALKVVFILRKWILMSQKFIESLLSGTPYQSWPSQITSPHQRQARIKTPAHRAALKQTQLHAQLHLQQTPPSPRKMSTLFEPSLSTSAMRPPLSSADAPSMADSLPNINFGFDELRDRMAKFTVKFDTFIEQGRKRVLEERNQFRMNVAELKGICSCSGLGVIYLTQ